MAQNKSKVYIGFEDEWITQKHLPTVNFTTNKAGGKPDWIENKSVTTNPSCRLCGLIMPLVVQIYAPLEKSLYHRTLYLFGCINPSCWNQNESWVCVRSQILDKSTPELERSTSTVESFDWCDGANVWEDEENGNVFGNTRDDKIGRDSLQLSNMLASMDFNNSEEVSSVGAMGHLLSPMATAEIDGDEDEVVTIDTPVTAETNMVALFDQAKPVPQVPSDSLEFVSFFISVSEEDEVRISSPVNAECNSQFQMYDEESNSIMDQRSLGQTGAGSGEIGEKYEKSLPAHGDKLFHTFISRIQKHPGQILRYIREGGSPLLLYPAGEVPQRCQHCQGSLMFEVQLLPTLIPSLQLVGSGCGHIEFGTVLVMTCQRSCWLPQDTVRSEYVLVQREL
uniref:Programmed cell death protein 2 C-terminal domain-containing protein n=1 Tax=Graphocephala atropunctata TaxID=36148 RepID=A0A1B6KXX9_9HEMI